MVELLLIGVLVALPLRLIQRRAARRRSRLEAAYDRARTVRFSGSGPHGPARAVYSESLFNARR